METTRSSKGGEEYEKWKEIKDSQKLFHTRRERERESSTLSFGGSIHNTTLFIMFMIYIRYGLKYI